MTIFYLIRHADNDQVGKVISGRKPGLSLNRRGREQAETLAEKLAEESITRVFSSPLERTRETAEPLARKLNVRVEVCEALNEVEYGKWTGKSFEELAAVSGWHQWKRFRSVARPPEGESMAEVQTRVLRELHCLRDSFPDQRLALFTHAGIIKAPVAFFLGMGLDALLHMEISPASWTVLGLNGSTARIFCVNRI